jgi:hypothetical protein
MNANWRFLTLVCGTWALLGPALGLAAAQAPPEIRIFPIPLGGRPAGMEFSPSSAGLAIAISDTNSVSIYTDPTSSGRKVEQIPSPYAIAFCGDSYTPPTDIQMLVTSPSAGLVTLLNYDSRRVLATFQVVARPYSVTCWGTAAFISSYGDDRLVVVHLGTGRVLASVDGVAASRSLRGVAVTATKGTFRAWVAGTDANMVTVVDLDAWRVLARIPVRRPTAIRKSRSGGQVYVASADDNAILSIDADTLAILPPYLSNVPNPQDIDLGSDYAGGPMDIGKFIPGGALNSVARVWNGQVTIIPGIPGAASVVAAGYSAWVTSPDTNSVYYIQLFWGPGAFPLANAASFESTSSAAALGPAPGSLASKFAATGVTQSFYASSLPLPTALGGVSISVGGRLDYS